MFISIVLPKILPLSSIYRTVQLIEYCQKKKTEQTGKISIFLFCFICVPKSINEMCSLVLVTEPHSLTTVDSAQNVDNVNSLCLKISFDSNYESLDLLFRGHEVCGSFLRKLQA